MTPEQIAARLTPAQRKALLWLPGDGSATPPIHTDPNTPRRDVRHRLRAAHLAQFAHGSAYCLTQLGQAVRAIVEKEDRT